MVYYRGNALVEYLTMCSNIPINQSLFHILEFQSRPEEYYGRLGQWISWDHFLLGDTVDDNNDDSEAEESSH